MNLYTNFQPGPPLGYKAYWENYLKNVCTDWDFANQALRDMTSDRDKAIVTALVTLTGALLHKSYLQRVTRLIFSAGTGFGTVQYMWTAVLPRGKSPQLYNPPDASKRR